MTHYRSIQMLQMLAHWEHIKARDAKDIHSNRLHSDCEEALEMAIVLATEAASGEQRSYTLRGSGESPRRGGEPRVRLFAGINGHEGKAKKL